MKLSTATRSFNLLGILASLGLAACVFAWGLQYKLSLYDPPQTASHRVPEAKLLSKNERIGVVESAQAILTKPSSGVSYSVPAVFFFFLLLAVGELNPQLSRQREHSSAEIRRLCSGLFITFFVRPPPILA